MVQSMIKYKHFKSRGLSYNADISGRMQHMFNTVFNIILNALLTFYSTLMHYSNLCKKLSICWYENKLYQNLNLMYHQVLLCLFLTTILKRLNLPLLIKNNNPMLSVWAPDLQLIQFYVSLRKTLYLGGKQIKQSKTKHIILFCKY